MAIQQITIIGTGLIGGSLGLALKKRGFGGRIVGCDREAVLAQARERGAIDTGVLSPEDSVHGSEVVVLATPVGAIIDLIEKIGPLAGAGALITDVGSTKAEIVARARDVFGNDVVRRFLPGHPMAGKEHGGVEHADADLFAGAAWLITPLPEQDFRSGLAGEYLQWIEKIGARVLPIDVADHDRVCAWVSHLPQMIATAFAATLADELGADSDASAIGGRALREMTRIASSPYSMWRDIALTNSTNLEQALMKLEQRLAHIRENLRSRELEAEFERARAFMQGQH